MNRRLSQSVKTNKRAVTTLGIIWLLVAFLFVALQLTSPKGVQISWETESEFATAGFNIYRSDHIDSNYQRLNKTLIPSKGDSVSGNVYSYLDEEVVGGQAYYYRLEEVELDGTQKSYDPIESIAKHAPLWQWLIAPLSGIIGIILIGFSLKTDEGKM